MLDHQYPAAHRIGLDRTRLRFGRWPCRLLGPECSVRSCRGVASLRLDGEVVPRGRNRARARSAVSTLTAPEGAHPGPSPGPARPRAWQRGSPRRSPKVAGHHLCSRRRPGGVRPVGRARAGAPSSAEPRRHPPDASLPRLSIAKAAALRAYFGWLSLARTPPRTPPGQLSAPRTASRRPAFSFPTASSRCCSTGRPAAAR